MYKYFLFTFSILLMQTNYGSQHPLRKKIVAKKKIVQQQQPKKNQTVQKPKPQQSQPKQVPNRQQRKKIARRNAPIEAQILSNKMKTDFQISQERHKELTRKQSSFTTRNNISQLSGLNQMNNSYLQSQINYRR